MKLRHATFEDTSQALTAMADEELSTAVEHAPVLGRGIGGSRTQIHVNETPVFVKRVPLTDRELEPDCYRSTANLFHLPPYCQYGMGSPGFTAWRELIANERLTALALASDSKLTGIPLLYHWRVIEGSAFDGEMPEELSDPDWLAERWHGSSEVAERVAAVKDSSHTLALFLEYIPHRLDQWLHEKLLGDDESASLAISNTEAQLRDQVAAMNHNSLFHFDAHFANILTDGNQIYLADLGLATATDFDLVAEEREFLVAHSTYDMSNVLTRLVNLLTEHFHTADYEQRNRWIESVAAGTDVTEAVPGYAAAVIRRYAAVAAIINRFNANLYGTDRRTPYPSAAAASALAAAGVDDLL